MTAPQLRFYAATRAGCAAVIETSSGQVVAWIIHDGGRLRARRGAWSSSPVDTLAQIMHVVGEAVDKGDIR